MVKQDQSENTASPTTAFVTASFAFPGCDSKRMSCQYSAAGMRAKALNLNEAQAWPCIRWA